MSQLTEEELEALRKLIPLADQIEEEAKYKAARLLVLKTWRQGLILVGGIIAGVVLMKDYLLKFLGAV